MTQLSLAEEADDMGHRIARLFEPLLRLLLPGTGHRRRTATARGGAHRRRPARHQPPPRHRALLLAPHGVEIHPHLLPTPTEAPA